ncbi:Palmitoyltransferase AKR1 [Colletotrichum fructicola]|nr:Palmitoyltransferase AKR1 [Colletotrichum fructicola]
MQSSLKTLFQIIGLQEQSNMALEIDSIKSLVIDLSDKLEGSRNTEPVLTAGPPRYPFLSLVAPSVISLGCIVAEDSAAMIACGRGDLFTLKQQLKSGKATLGDITSQRWSLMTSAIKGGSKEVVEFLLDNGINVNTTFGEKQTSPLQWAIRLRKLDIVERLVSRGADVNHISMNGWSAIFYLWPITKMGQGSMLDQINLLARADDIELNLIDKWGWTLLHRLAAYGTDLEVRRVIKLGADLMIKQLPLGWSAVFHSVFYGNLGTLIELMRHYPQSVIFDTDERGWTLLHIAASAGHRDITRHLLEVGSNPYAESRPFWSHIPESIWGRRCTPAEAAAAQSRERLVQYEDLLEDLGIERKLVLLGDGEEKGEQFWDAEEIIS